MNESRRLVDEYGKPIGDAPVEPLPPAVQALIETRVNTALDQLRIDNERALKDLTRKASLPWKWFTALAIIANIATFFVGYSEVRGWIKEEVQKGMTQPEIQKAAKAATAATMNEFVENQLKPLREVIATTSLTVSNLQADADFLALETSAQMGSHSAFNHLGVIATNSLHRQQESAALAYVAIVEKHNQVQIFPDLYIRDALPDGLDGEKAALKEIESEYRKQLDDTRLINMLSFVTHSIKFTKRERMEFLIRVNEHDRSLRVSEWAGRFFNELAGTNFKPLATRSILAWWKENQNRIVD
ncbi:MAG TPA: hypothetical protein VFT34_08250 [Verrucomicrobiae bacterium]|nr:hypothetical protein [Verrucomicrobiae bacterium]